MLFVVLLAARAAPAAEPIKLVVNGRPVATDVSPYLDDRDRTMVPIRFVAEALGDQVDWEAAAQQVTIRKDSTTIVLHIGQTAAQVNGQKMTMDTTPVLDRGRTMVPLRFVGEALGAVVDWDAAGRTVTVAYAPGEGQPSSTTPPLAPSAELVITGSRVNIRYGPSTEYPVITQVERGDKLPVRGQQGGWYQLELPGGQLGWVLGSLGRVENPPAPPASEPAGPAIPPAAPADPGVERVAVVTATNVNIRGGPGTSFPVVGKTDTGGKFPITGEQGDWYQIALSRGSRGWIYAPLVAVQVSQAASRGEEPSVDPAAPQGSGSLTSIEEIAVDRYDGGISITIAAAEPPAYRVLRLSAPERLVIDIPGAVLAGQPEGEQQAGTGGDLVTGVRYAQFAPDTVRVVADLAGPVAWTSRREGSTLIFSLGPVSLAGQVIVLDPGHGVRQDGGWSDPGAIGPTGLLERDVVLDIAQRAGNILISKGAEVIFTRTADTTITLQERAEMANRYRADAFISIHLNASVNPGVQGTSVYYYTYGIQASRQLAQAIQQELVKSIRRPDLGIKQADFAVLRYAAVPAVLVEVAFISNPEEEALFYQSQFRQQAAEGIVNGVLAYFGGSRT